MKFLILLTIVAVTSAWPVPDDPLLLQPKQLVAVEEVQPDKVAEDVVVPEGQLVKALPEAPKDVPAIVEEEPAQPAKEPEPAIRLIDPTNEGSAVQESAPVREEKIDVSAPVPAAPEATERKLETPEETNVQVEQKPIDNPQEIVKKLEEPEPKAIEEKPVEETTNNNEENMLKKEEPAKPLNEPEQKILKQDDQMRQTRETEEKLSEPEKKEEIKMEAGLKEELIPIKEKKDDVKIEEKCTPEELRRKAEKELKEDKMPEKIEEPVKEETDKLKSETLEPQPIENNETKPSAKHHHHHSDSKESKESDESDESNESTEKSQ